MPLRYRGYLADAAAIKPVADETMRDPVSVDHRALLEVGRRAARSLTLLDAEAELWDYLEERTDPDGRRDGELWIEELESVALPASTALLEALGWVPPPPAGTLVREAQEAVRATGGLRLSGRVRRGRVRTLRNEIAGLVLDLEHRLGEEPRDDPGQAEGDVLTPTRTRTLVEVVKGLGQKLERSVNLLAAILTISGADPGMYGGEDIVPPAVVEQVEQNPRALRELWMDVIDGGSFLDQLDDDAVEALSELRDQGEDDPDLALWLAILDGDDAAVYQAVARGASPDRALWSVLDQHRGRRW